MVSLTFDAREPLPGSAVGVRIHHPVSRRRCSRPWAITSRKLLKRKISTSAREPEQRAEHGGRDLLADRERGHLRAAGEDRQQQRLLHARPTRREREHGCDDLHGEHQQAFRTDPPMWNASSRAQ